ncbi:MAG: DUF4350 domain-containing protein [Rhodoglobus sp.]
MLPPQATPGVTDTQMLPPQATANVTDQQVLTPRVRTVVRRWLFWGGAAVVALVIGVVAFAFAGNAAAGGYLDPDNAAPLGSKAVAEVLRQQGVNVIVTTTLVETQDAVDKPEATTLFVYDTDQLLEASQWRTIAGLTDRVIIADAGFVTLRVVAPAVAQAGVVDGTLSADCDLPVVERAASVTGSGSGFRVVDDAAPATACLGSGDGVYSLVEVPRASGTVTVLGATDAITNEQVIDNGNAAFALGLLGENDTLVWYLPSFADLESTAPATLGDLTPLWVTPALSLLVVAVIAAAIWRGRRLGPLVIENLPVTVRASETMQGRARLYERSNARLRALDALRVGSVQRLAATRGLSRLATIEDVVGAVAAATGAQVGEIRRLLVDDIPTSDRDLLTLSDALLTLERDVTRALRP